MYNRPQTILTNKPLKNFLSLNSLIGRYDRYAIYGNGYISFCFTYGFNHKLFTCIFANRESFYKDVRMHMVAWAFSFHVVWLVDKWFSRNMWKWYLDLSLLFINCFANLRNLRRVFAYIKPFHDYIDEQRELWRWCANTHGRMGSRYLRNLSSPFSWEWSNIVNF